MVSLSSCSYEGYRDANSYFKRDTYSYSPSFVNSKSTNAYRNTNRTRIINRSASRIVPIQRGEYTGKDLARDLNIDTSIWKNDPTYGYREWEDYFLGRNIGDVPIERQYTGKDLARDLNIDTSIWKNDPRYGYDGLRTLENYPAPDNNEYGNKDFGRDTQNSVIEQGAEGNLAQSLGLKSIGEIVQKGMNDPTLDNDTAGSQSLAETVDNSTTSSDKNTSSVNNNSDVNAASTDASSSNDSSTDDTSSNNSNNDNSSPNATGTNNPGTDAAKADNSKAKTEK